MGQWFAQMPQLWKARLFLRTLLKHSRSPGDLERTAIASLCELEPKRAKWKFVKFSLELDQSKEVASADLLEQARYWMDHTDDLNHLSQVSRDAAIRFAEALIAEYPEDLHGYKLLHSVDDSVVNWNKRQAVETDQRQRRIHQDIAQLREFPFGTKFQFHMLACSYSCFIRSPSCCEINGEYSRNSF